jgi:acetolactate synthase regulatory subunit
MDRRRLPIAILLTAVVCASAASCGSGEQRAEFANRADGSGHTAGFGVDQDARVSSPLPAPPPASVGAVMGSRSSRGGTPAAKSSGPEAPEQSPSPLQLPAQLQQPGAMLIRAGNATVQVDSIDAGIARVRRLAQDNGALVANTVVQAGREQQRSASLELRVASERFDALVNGLAPIGKVEMVNISVQDVGEEFVDLTARVANARRLEARLIELLANRTGRLSDVLTVERELARVREEIERYEGRLRYLQSRASVSSLTVTVHEPAPVVAAHPGQNVIADAFVQAWRNFVLLVAGFISTLGVLVPLAAIAGGAYVLWRRYGQHKPAVTEQA